MWFFLVAFIVVIVILKLKAPHTSHEVKWGWCVIITGVLFGIGGLSSGSIAAGLLFIASGIIGGIVIIFTEPAYSFQDGYNERMRQRLAEGKTCSNCRSYGNWNCTYSDSIHPGNPGSISCERHRS